MAKSKKMIRKNYIFGGVNRVVLARPATSDAFVMEENDYEKVQYNDKDVWLDIGANIGSFPLKYAHRVHTMICFEPDPTNYGLLSKNIANNNIDNVVAYEGMVKLGFSPKSYLYLNDGINKAKHSTYDIAGYAKKEVAAYNIGRLLESFKPNAIKIDIEGYEYELLTYLTMNENLKGIDKLVFEYHFNPALVKRRNISEFTDIIAKLTKQGFNISKLAKDLKYKTEVIYASRV